MTELGNTAPGENNAPYDGARFPPKSQVLQQIPQSPQVPLTESQKKEQKPSDIRQGQRSESEHMWDAIDGFIDATRSRKNSMRSSKPRPLHSRQLSSASQARLGTPTQTHHGRTVAQASGPTKDPIPPMVPPKRETPVSAMSRKGELKSSFKGLMRSRLTEKLVHPVPYKTKPSEFPIRKDSIRESVSYRSHVRKDTISSPIPLDPCSLLPQCSLSIHQSERTTLARTAQLPSTSGTSIPIPIPRKPVAAVEEERDIQAILQPSPKHAVHFAQSRVPRHSVQALTDMSSEAPTMKSKSIRLQANRQTRNARTTKFGDFMAVSTPKEENDTMPPLPNIDALEKLNRRSTLRAQQISSMSEESDGPQPAGVSILMPEEPNAETEDIRPSRKDIKSEWIAAASACVLSEPLVFEPCRSCELPFDGGSETEKTCKGQLCGECIAKQPKCLYCGKEPFSATSEITQHGIWCKNCADGLPYPCGFCGKEVARMYQKRTNSGLMCWECAGAKTPHEIGPGEDWPRYRRNSEDRAPTPPPKSPESHKAATSKPLPPRPLLTGQGASRRWPERNTSLTPIAKKQASSESSMVASSISPAVLKRNHSPLSILEQDLGIETQHEDQDAISEISENWRTDMTDITSDDETVSQLPDQAEYKKRETFALLPLPRAQSPFTPDLKRVASSIYPTDEGEITKSAGAPPLPPIPAAYQLHNTHVYGIPANPYEEERRRQPITGLRDYNLANAVKHSTLLDIVNYYLDHIESSDR